MREIPDSIYEEARILFEDDFRPRQLAALLHEKAELEREMERLTAERFAPLGDNHHNAAKCPYCNPQLVEILAERDSLKQQLADLRKQIEDDPNKLITS